AESTGAESTGAESTGAESTEPRGATAAERGSQSSSRGGSVGSNPRSDSLVLGWARWVDSRESRVSGWLSGSRRDPCRPYPSSCEEPPIIRDSPEYGWFRGVLNERFVDRRPTPIQLVWHAPPAAPAATVSYLVSYPSLNSLICETIVRLTNMPRGTRAKRSEERRVGKERSCREAP